MCGGGGESQGGRGRGGFGAGNRSKADAAGLAESQGDSGTSGAEFGQKALGKIGGLVGSLLGGPVVGAVAEKAIGALTEGQVGEETPEVGLGRSDSKADAPLSAKPEDAAVAEAAAKDVRKVAKVVKKRTKTKTVLAGSQIAKNQLKTKLGQ